MSRVGPESAQYHGIAADFFIGPQVVTSPPDQRIPPEDRTGQPLDPANPMVSTFNVGHFVGDDQAEFMGRNGLQQCLRDDDFDAAT